MQELTPGLELGARFVLVRRIGRGESAEVWLASDRERGGEVALKFFDESVTGDAARLARLESEVALSAALPPGLTVAVHGLERVDGRIFLVMEYLEGGDLGQLRGRSFESWSRAGRRRRRRARGAARARARAPRPQVRQRLPRRRRPGPPRRLRPHRARGQRGVGAFARTTRARSSCAASRRSPRTTSMPSARCSTN